MFNQKHVSNVNEETSWCDFDVVDCVILSGLSTVSAIFISETLSGMFFLHPVMLLLFPVAMKPH